MTASELFREGRLDEAIAAQVAAVKAAPADLGRRTFLFELYAFAGDLERAERQLGVIEGQSSEHGFAVTAYKQCLEAEAASRRAFTGEGGPQYLAEPPAHVRRHADALRLLGADRVDEARTELAAAAAERPAVSGTADGSAFADFRDADDLLAPVLEFYDGPVYRWVPIESVVSLTLTPPKKPRDLLWNVAELSLTDGTTRSGVMPVLYAGSHEADEATVRLGRQTDWLGYEGGPVLGRGMRTFLVDGQERGMLETLTVTFGGP